MRKTLLAAALLAASPMALAQGYMGAAFGVLEYKLDGIEGKPSLASLHVAGGYQVNEFVAAEGRVGFGVGDDEHGNNELKLKNSIGGYVKVGYPIEEFYPYVIGGFTRVELEAEDSTGIKTKESISDLSYGAGLGFLINHSAVLQAEYLRLADDDGHKLDAFTFGINFLF